MGWGGYGVNQWDQGEYTGANNQQDDLDIITTQNYICKRPVVLTSHESCGECGADGLNSWGEVGQTPSRKLPPPPQDVGDPTTWDPTTWHYFGAPRRYYPIFVSISILIIGFCVFILFHLYFPTLYLI